MYPPQSQGWSPKVLLQVFGPPGPAAKLCHRLWHNFDGSVGVAVVEVGDVVVHVVDPPDGWSHSRRVLERKGIALCHRGRGRPQVVRRGPRVLG